jgi:hypothetical protein
LTIVHALDYNLLDGQEPVQSLTAESWGAKPMLAGQNFMISAASRLWLVIVPRHVFSPSAAFA